MTGWPFISYGSLVLTAAAASFALILALRPLFVRYALARPNARSSHAKPTPQGGGLAVVAATLGVAGLACLWTGILDPALLLVFGAAGLTALMGLADDIRPIAAAPRLLLQAAALTAVLVALPADLRIVAGLPFWLERLLLLIALLWFVNLTNFMDGIDWMTVATVVPISAALIIAGALRALPLDATIVALALFGAILGFAPFNRPVATLFLGDVGSLPIGLLTGWLLVLLAGEGHLAAALLLPLYYLADATITLMRRALSGETFWEAHRTHFYQRALVHGHAVPEIVTRVFIVNAVLAVLAIATVVYPNAAMSVVALLIGACLVGLLLFSFLRQAQ